MKKILLAACACLLAAPTGAAENTYRKMAEELGAKAGKKMRVAAVLPFGCAQGPGTCPDGRLLGERLTTELINHGRFTVLAPGQYSKELEEFAFRPADGAAPALLKRLKKELGVDAVVTGLAADLGAGRSELNVRRFAGPGGAAWAAVGAVVGRDWAAAPEPRDLRSLLRALAKRGVKVSSMPEWADFSRLKAGSLAARLSIAALGGSEKMSDYEIEAWKDSPAEAVSTVNYFCAATDCAALGVTGAGYYKAYFPDGFVLALDEAGDVLDCYYPERSYSRLRLRLLARRAPGRNLAGTADWDKFRQTMDSRYVPVPDRRDPDSLRTEIDKWKLGPGEKVTGIYSPETPEKPDFYKVTFADGFTLVFDGPTGVIERCEYGEPAR